MLLKDYPSYCLSSLRSDVKQLFELGIYIIMFSNVLVILHIYNG